MKNILILGGTGFIGRNLVEKFSLNEKFKVVATNFSKNPPNIDNVTWIHADLTKKDDVDKVFHAQSNYDVVIQAAASTSGIMDTFNRPDFHVTDNAIMNSLILRAISISIAYFVSIFIILSLSHLVCSIYLYISLCKNYFYIYRI